MIVWTKQFGRGVFASQTYLPGDTIEVAEIIPFTPHDTETILNTKLRLYTYKYNNIMDCIVLGNGCLYNHNEKPNVSYVIEQNSTGRPVMVFKALNHIRTYDQLFVSYTQDSPGLDVTAYVGTYAKETTSLDRELDIGPECFLKSRAFYVSLLDSNKKITLRILQNYFPNADWCQAHIDERINRGELIYKDR